MAAGVGTETAWNVMNQMAHDYPMFDIRRDVSPGRARTFRSSAGMIGTFLIVVLALLVFTAGSKAGGSRNPREYQLKAVFLFNFAQFTEWPTNAFGGPDAPLVIGVLGTDPFGPILDEIVRDETVRGRKLVVQRFGRVGEIRACHILYIGESEARRLAELLRHLKDRPILTVSDIEGSATRGVIIRFITEGGNVRFRVNVDSLRAAKLTLSSKLLRAAEIFPESAKP